VRYDVFCKIVDNFGDAAVCWRLAWQLANEHGHQMRLWIDQPDALGILKPALERSAVRQTLEGVEVIHWSPDDGFDDPGDVVIEGFGCGLPESLVKSMAGKAIKPLWIVLEYLSAETWVDDHHGLPSPHPAHALPRYFFFPGFSKCSGGLIRERNLPAMRAGFLANDDGARRLWRELGHAPPGKPTLTVSLFGYDNPNVGSLLNAFANGGVEVIAVAPPSRLRQQISESLGQPHHPDGTIQRRGSLELRFAPFLPQSRYDELLWMCDWNFVRGEDSFVRAQWAAKPFVWHIYPQDNRVHLQKLDAFLQLYLDGLDSGVANALAGLWRSWNGSGQFLAQYWNALQSHAAPLRAHADRWKTSISELPDLTTNLANFCSERLK
jgi:uncharacterized repeat protein (TIGR03837 family)